MELNELQKIGLIILMIGYSDKKALSELLTEAGNGVAGSWMQLDDAEKEELRECAKEGTQRLNDIIEKNLKQ